MKLRPPLSFLARLSLACALLLPAASLSPAWAQAPAPAPATLDQKDADQAATLADAGKFAEAAKLYEDIPKKYPTSGLIPQATLRLGYVYFRMQQYDKAVATLQKVPTLKGAPPEATELALSLVPQVLSAQAGNLKATEPRRKAIFAEAVKQFDVFLQKFPNSAEVETANYGKAVALYQLERYDDGMQALKINLTRFPQSQSVLDSQYLLALTIGTVANIAAQKAPEPNKDPAINTGYESAEKMLADVINKGGDVALAADSRFQIGELLFTRAGLTKDAEAKKGFFNRALESYRLVAPKDIVVAAQKNRIERIRALRLPLLQARDLEGVKRIDRAIEKEGEKLGNIEARPDQTLSAKLKMGEIYFQLGQMDETRVVMNFVQKFVEDPEQKKQVAYLLAMSFASQNAEAKGAVAPLAKRTEEAYEAFKKAHNNDPIGENLPLIVGSGFVDKEPEKAIKYFKEFSTLYPQSKLRAVALTQEAAAYVKLERYDEALKMFQETLKQNPEKEIAAAADFGMATILQKTGKIPEALAAFKNVRTKYKGTPQAEQAGFYFGQLTLESGDAKGAVPALTAFIKDNPKSELLPNALYFLGDAQNRAGQRADSLITYKKVAEQFPKSEVAPFSYFQRAGMLQADGKSDEVVALMREFIDKNGESPELYKAYDFIAQIQISQQKENEGIATYESFVKAKPGDPNAAVALLRVATLWKARTDKLPRFSALSDEQKAEWTKAVENAIKACERVFREFPTSDRVALALNTTMDCFKMREQAKLVSSEDVESYFQKLANEFKDKPATRSKIVFTLASNLLEKDKAKAITLMSGVYDPNQKYAPDDMDIYGSALLEQKKLDEAEKIFIKLGADYPTPKNVEPNKASREIQEAQSISLFGRGKVAQERGKTELSKPLFDELEKFYGWSPKMLEANYGIALTLEAQKQYPEALKRLRPVITANTASAELRAKAMLLLARILEAQGNAEDAINNYVKISVYYGGVPTLAAEGLWRGAQLLEKQSTGEIPIATPTPRPQAGAKPPVKK